MSWKRSDVRDYDDEREDSDQADTRQESSFVTDQQAVEMIEKASEAREDASQTKQEPRSDKFVERKFEKKGFADLTQPEWGKFAHKAVQDAVQEANPDAEAEKHVTVIKDDGTEGRGFIDVLVDGEVLEVKTDNLDRMSDRELVGFLDRTARQIERYQWSPSIEGKPRASAFFEFSPSSVERREFMEKYLERRGIKTIWGID